MTTSPEALRSRELSNALLIPSTDREELPAYDPLLNSFEFPLQKTFYPRGFPVSISTNSTEVLEAAAESWGQSAQLFTAPEIRIQIGILPSLAPHPLTIPVCRSRENLLCVIADPHNFAMCDVRQGFAFGWLTEQTVLNHAYLRYHFLEATALLLVTAKYLTPIHGACVAWDGRGVLLCGDSGAGKSSLSFACARRGWTFLSDDATCLLRGRKGRMVIGNPEHIHFRESALDLFPELQRIPLQPRINGDISIELATKQCSEISTAYEAKIDFVLFLRRQETGRPSIAPFSVDSALAHLSQVMCYGDKHQLEEQKQSLWNLLSANVLEFRYSDLDSGVAFLRELVEGRDD